MKREILGIASVPYESHIKQKQNDHPPLFTKSIKIYLSILITFSLLVLADVLEWPDYKKILNETVSALFFGFLPFVSELASPVSMETQREALQEH